MRGSVLFRNRSVIKRPTDSTTGTTSGQTSTTNGQTSITSRQTDTTNGPTSCQTSTTSGQVSTISDQTSFASTTIDEAVSAIIITVITGFVLKTNFRKFLFVMITFTYTFS